jgi:hypothetical protein
MRLLLAAGLPVALVAGCVNFGGPVEGSTCAAEDMLLEWKHPPARLARVALPKGFYDRAVGDPALDWGVPHQGDAVFKFRGRGKHLVEVFLAVADGGESSFLLEADGKPVDVRHQVKPGAARMMPRRRLRRLSLLGIVSGPAELKVRAGAGEYLLSAVRWRTLREFEQEWAPKWLERARYLAAHALYEADGERPSRRRDYLEQLYERLYLSRRPKVRQEAVIGLARVWYWLAAENHQPRDIEQAAEWLEKAWRASPQDTRVRQMIAAACTGLNTGSGAPLATGPFCDDVAPVGWEIALPFPPRNAPAWAVAQRRLARRMEAITRWWVEQRQHPGGELGGEWGDDVEILRSWGPQALGLGSEAAAQGLRRLADGVWNSGLLEHGYNRRIADVEHSSEPTTDTQPLAAALDPDAETLLERLKLTAQCAYHWIAPQPDGRYRFRGAWFNCCEFDPKPERALDVHYNVRAMGPALWYAYFSRDARLIGLLANWGESWREAMRRTDHGKPAGIIPSAVRSADGSYLIGSDAWDKPEAEWDYYQWSGRSQEAITSLFLALEDLTGEPRWLEAVAESFAVFSRCDAFPRLCDQIRQAPEAFYEWRRRSADARFDKAFPYTPAANDDAQLKAMAQLAAQAEQRLAYNFDMFTSEVLYTDRVYYGFPAAYQPFLFGGAAPRGERYPLFAVTWPVSRADFARGVLEATATSVRLRIYSFEPAGHPIAVRLWRLRPGLYRWETKDLGGRLLASREVKIDRLPARVDFEAPPRQEVTISGLRLAN